MTRILLMIAAILAASLSGAPEARASCAPGIAVGNDCGFIWRSGCCKGGSARYWCDGFTLCKETCPRGDCGGDSFDGHLCGAENSFRTEECTLPTCTPDCGGVDCGDDGCGGSCGSCYGGSRCEYGTCVPPECTPDCAGKECGDDGCGASCGGCNSGKECQGNRCVTPCMPDCADKQCGDNGCGAPCGTCPTGHGCEAGHCVAPQVCVPDCTGRKCGDDGCDGVCGTCMPPETCSTEGLCQDPSLCTPNCTGKQCGSNGCGGLCGACDTGQSCSNGRCRDGDIPSGDAIESDGAAEASEDAPTPSTETAGTRDTPTPTCPPGQVMSYGACVAEAGPESKGGGCAASTSGGGWPVLALLFLLAPLLLGTSRFRDRC